MTVIDKALIIGWLMTSLWNSWRYQKVLDWQNMHDYEEERDLMKNTAPRPSVPASGT